MDWIKTEPRDLESPAINNAIEKLSKKKKIPRVNLPALARRDTPFMETWQADPGHVFVSCDFSSLEPSISAHFSNDPFYSYACYGGIGKKPWIHENGTLMIDDVYLMTASRLPGMSDTIVAYFRDPKNQEQWVIDSEVVKSDPIIKPLRSRAKPACLGFNYGMGPRKFVSQAYDAGMNIELSQAKAMFKAYWELFANIQQFANKLGAYLQKNGAIVNPFGYRLNTEPRKGYNGFIQSSASGVVDVLSLEFFERANWARFIAFIHDEIIFSIPIDRLDETKRVKEEVNQWLNETLQFSIPMRLGWVHGTNFSEIK